MHFKQLAPVMFTITLLALAVVASTVSAASVRGAVLRDSFDRHARGVAWNEGSSHGAWVVDFTGYGRIAPAGPGRSLRLAPRAAAHATETHAALVHSTATQGDLVASLTMATTRQLRTGSAPNPWERAWTLWHFTDATHFYYVVLKNNGWEIGKADPAYPGSQRFLATGSTPTFPIGMRTKVELTQRGATFTVRANGQLLTTFTDAERPYLSGSIGLYSEDAGAAFDDLVVRGR